jgi:hypothetical protein
MGSIKAAFVVRGSGAGKHRTRIYEVVIGGSSMQKIAAIISLVAMSTIMILSLTGFDHNFMFNIAMFLFVVLVFKKGIERNSIRDVMNIRKQKISLNSMTSLIELIITVEFIVIGEIPDVSFVEYPKIEDAVIGTVIYIGFVMVVIAFFYRVFFLNMFNEEKVNKEKWMRIMGKK